MMRIWLEDLWRDTRHAGLESWRNRGFSAAVVVLLGVGIGANSAMFGIVYGLLLRPVPYPEADRIVRVGTAGFGEVGPGQLNNRSLPALWDAAESFEHLAAFARISLVWSGPDGPWRLGGAAVSPSLLPLVGARLHLGQAFAAEGMRGGARRVVLLSYRTWRERFGSDRSIVGAAVELGGEPHTVLGVFGENFAFPGPDVEFWIPLVISPYNAHAPPEDIQYPSWFSVLGRLGPGVSADQAAAEVRTILGRAETGSPDVVVHVVPLRETIVGEHRRALVALSAAAGLVLVVVGVNVTSMLMARLLARQRGLALRTMLGASYRRIVRTLLTESVLLSVGGGALGLAVSAVVLHAGVVMASGVLPQIDDETIGSASIVAFAAGLSLCVGLVFGLLPATQGARIAVGPVSGQPGVEAAAGVGIVRTNRVRAVVIVGQVAVALALVIGAGALLRTFVGLVSVGLGYDATDVLTARVGNPHPLSLYVTPRPTEEELSAHLQRRDRFHGALFPALSRLEQLSGVAGVGLSLHLPVGTLPEAVHPFRVAGRPAPAETPLARMDTVNPGYFTVMRPHVRGGRVFTERDTVGAPLVAVVNETLAREVLGKPAVGQRLLLPLVDEPIEVVGVVADVTSPGAAGVAEAQSSPMIYLCMLQSRGLGFALPENLFVSIRTWGNPTSVISFLREAVAEANAVPDEVMTMAARRSEAYARPRVYAVGAGLVAALALGLAAFSLHGMLSSLVWQRRQEFGVRMALGAQSSDILRLVVRQVGALVAAGVVIGLAMGAVTTRLLESLLFGVTPMDLPVVANATVILIGVAVAAAYTPARRAISFAPMDILRCE